MSLEVKIANYSSNPLPKYQTEKSSGMDIQVDFERSGWLFDEDSEEYKIIKPLERVLCKTGLFIELPDNYEAQIRPRSGLAFKYGVTVLNTPGTIDADYRGEIGVILINLSNEDFILRDKERIAQMIICPSEQSKLYEVILKEQLSSSDRGERGFGHTGK